MFGVLRTVPTAPVRLPRRLLSTQTSSSPALSRRRSRSRTRSCSRRLLRSWSSAPALGRTLTPTSALTASSSVPSVLVSILQSLVQPLVEQGVSFYPNQDLGFLLQGRRVCVSERRAVIYLRSIASTSIAAVKVRQVWRRDRVPRHVVVVSRCHPDPRTLRCRVRRRAPWHRRVREGCRTQQPAMV